MYYDQESGRTSFLTGVLVGALLGVSVAVLMAPQRGALVRARLIERVLPRHEPAERERVPRHRGRVRR